METSCWPSPVTGALLLGLGFVGHALTYKFISVTAQAQGEVRDGGAWGGRTKLI